MHERGTDQRWRGGREAFGRKGRKQAMSLYPVRPSGVSLLDEQSAFEPSLRYSLQGQ